MLVSCSISSSLSLRCTMDDAYSTIGAAGCIVFFCGLRLRLVGSVSCDSVVFVACVLWPL